MSNVLDLKQLQADELERQQAPEEPVAQESSIANEFSENDIAAMLAAPAFPQEIAWEAHHQLTGGARNKHNAILGGLVALGAVVGYWQASVMTFLVSLAGATALGVRERWSKPIRVSIDEHGVAVDGRHMNHAQFASFDVHAMPDDTVELSLQSASWSVPHFRLPLGEQNPSEVSDVLSQYIPKGRHPIPRIDYFLRK